MTSQTPHSLSFEGLALEQEVPLSRLTSFRVGGPAQFLARPASPDELAQLLGAARNEGLPVTLLGGGTNVLAPDAGVRGLVVVLTGLTADPVISQDKGTTTLKARAGLALSALCRLAMDKGLSGLEWAAGIPGTLGGALAMNAGSFGSQMADITDAIEILDTKTLTIHRLLATELKFAYRTLALEDAVILGADLALVPTDPDTVRTVHSANLNRKKTTQPVSRASAGCFFKNPSPENPAGRLIQEAGLKGYVHKGAMVSDLHANFIINHDHATCRDILDLADLVAARVMEKFTIRLEKEVKPIGS